MATIKITLNELRSIVKQMIKEEYDNKFYDLLYDYVDDKMIEGDIEAKNMIVSKGYNLTYDELYDYVDRKMIKGDIVAKSLLRRINKI